MGANDNAYVFFPSVLFSVPQHSEGGRGGGPGGPAKAPQLPPIGPLVVMTRSELQKPFNYWPSNNHIY